MRRVEEIIYIVPERREEFLRQSLNPPLEVQRVLWTHGVRNQYYFQLNEYILMTFEYAGHEFYKDMDKIAAYLAANGCLVEKRRKDVPEEERAVTDWWAPIKRLGSVLTESPMPEDIGEELSMEEQYHEMLSGGMQADTVRYDISYDDDDWSESVHI